MANSIQVSVLCQSGRVAVFSDDNVSAKTTTTLQTGGVGLNQTSGVDLGNFLVGETIIAAYGTVQAATTVGAFASYLLGFIENPDGSIAVPIEGGGNNTSDMPMLCKPVRVTVGMLLKIQMDVSSTSTVSASVVAYCASGKTSVFNVQAGADARTAIVDITTGGSIGQSLSNQRIVKYYATFDALYGANDAQDGLNFFFIESSQGQLKSTLFPTNAKGPQRTVLVECNIPIAQNDTLSVTWGS